MSVVNASSGYFSQPPRPAHLLPRIIDPFFESPLTLVKWDVDSLWNGHFVNPNINKKAEIAVKKVQRKSGDALLENAYMVRLVHMEKDLVPASIVTLEFYRSQYFEINLRKKFTEKALSQFKRGKSKRDRSSGGGIDLLETDLISLNINGSISIKGDLIFKEQELQYSSQYGSANDWELDIEQTQRFTINGKIGKKLNIKIKQDSEADFDFENDMSISYDGDDDDILQDLEAGNIGFSFQDGSTLINKGGGSSNSGLFGFKMKHQLGPVKINSILAQENSQKQVKTISGSEEAQEVLYNDYDFVKDRLFFLDDIYRFNYYPLDSNLYVTYIRELEIEKLHVYKTTVVTEGSVINATAYYDWETKDELRSESGLWVRMESGIDYSYNPRLGYIILHTTLTNEAIAVAWRDQNDIGKGDIITNLENLEENENIQLRLIKARGRSQPSKYTWPLMMKNAYYVGGSGTDYSKLEVDIIWANGETGLEISPPGSQKSFLELFGLDTRKFQNGSFTAGTDNKIDLFSSIIDTLSGLLMFPMHLPFARTPDHFNNFATNEAYFIDLLTDENGNYIYADSTTYKILNIAEEKYWGNHADEIKNGDDFILPDLNDHDGDFDCDAENCPAMYFSSYMPDIISEHEFVLKVTKKQRSTSINLGFMIVEGSDEVTVNGKQMSRGRDYEIDSFSNEIRFIGDAKTIVMDPNAKIVIAYEDHNLFNFDNRVLAGSSMRWDFSENSFLGATALYYNQSIIDKKVEVGREPMRNFIWDVNGTYQRNLDFVTEMVDRLPFIKTTNLSSMKLTGEYAQVISNPNSLESGIAFIDDFESSKHTSSPSIKASFFNKGGPPLVVGDDGIPQTGNWRNMTDRGEVIWYNPYCQVATTEIWPDKATSAISGDQKTMTLNLVTRFGEQTSWAGIFSYLNEYDQNLENKKYVDIWLNDSGINTNDYTLHIDLGLISEDLNRNNQMDSEEDIHLGNGIVDEGEDTGMDGCRNDFENGKGGCLDLFDTGDGMVQLTYSEILNSYPQFIDSIYVEEDWDINGIYPCRVCSQSDPNGDDFFFNSSDNCGSQDQNEYKAYNGTENNSTFEGFNYPDTEDMNNDKALNTTEDYFTYSINLNPSLDTGEIEPVTQNGNWKQYSVPLSDFTAADGGYATWNNIKFLRIRAEVTEPPQVDELQMDTLALAKIEFVGNEWQSMGKADDDNMEWDDYEGLEISVVNTEEHASIYEPPEGVVREKDVQTKNYLREQALALSFKEKEGINGIPPYSIVAAKKVLNIPQAGKKNFKIYNFMEMFIYANQQGENEWNDDTSFLDTNNVENVQLIFRLEKDENNFYEIVKPLHATSGSIADLLRGWERNDLKIDLEELTRKKLSIGSLEQFEDVGKDGVLNEFENGKGGRIPEFLNFLEYTCEFSDIDMYDEQDCIENEFSWNEVDEMCQGSIYFELNGEIHIDNNTVVACEEDKIEEFQNLTFTQILSSYPQFQDYICNDWSDFGCFPCNTCHEGDPNGDKYIHGSNPFVEEQDDDISWITGTENDGNYQSGEPFTDINSNGVFDDPPSNFTEQSGWEWVELNHENEMWEKTRIKGKPTIDNIKNIVVGVFNNTNQRVNGHIYINELRMTGVQRKTGQAMKFSGDLNVADMVTFNGNYETRSADYHALQERLSEGDQKESFSITTTIKPDNFFSKKIGFNPIRLTYSGYDNAPQYFPGQSDVVLDDPSQAPDSIRSMSKTYGISTGFKKSRKGTKFYEKYFLDNISVGFNTSTKVSSNVNIEKDQVKTMSEDISYNLNLSDNPNFFQPLGVLQKLFDEEKEFLGTKFYWFPKKIKGSMKFTETDNFTINRNNPDTTFNQKFKLSSSFDMTYEPVRKLQTSYTLSQANNLDQYQFNKLALVEEATLGKKTSSNESFNISYNPELRWLQPKMSYNSSYVWKRDTSIDSLTTLTLGNNFKPSLNFSFTSFLEKFFTPKTQGQSSRSRPGSSSSRRSSGRRSSKNKKWIEIENPYVLAVLEKMHSFSKIIGSVKLEYKDDYSSSYGGILTDYKPGFTDKFLSEGLTFDSTLTTTDESKVRNSYSNTYETSISTSGFNLWKISISSIKYTRRNKHSVSENDIVTFSQNQSYLPLGITGKDGIPFPSYQVNISQLQKLPVIENLFKSISLSHGFTGDQEVTENDGEITKKHNLKFSPLFSLSSTTKNDIKFTLTGNYTLAIQEANTGGIDRDHVLSASSNLTYTKKGGLEIPLFFFRDLDLQNDLEFVFRTDYSYKWGEIKTVDMPDLTVNDVTRNFSLKPTLKYKLSNYVNFNLNYSYDGNYTSFSKWKYERGGGFMVEIKLRG